MSSSDDDNFESGDPTPKRQRLCKIIAHLDEALSTYQDATGAARVTAAAPAVEAGAAEATARRRRPLRRKVRGDAPSVEAANRVSVVVGTSQMARDDRRLVQTITAMVNDSYFEANRDLLGPHASGGSYRRTSKGDVLNRLAMGDAGPRANRVLHLAFQDAELVGCCSSTFQPPWTHEGCGHWGLLVVKQSAQGTGVATALVAAAEARLARSCSRVQIEY